MMVKFYTMDSELVSVVYVEPGKKVKIRLPRGDYMAKYAWGPQWFGEKEYFGKIALYDWDNEKFELRSGYYYIYEFSTPEPDDVGSGSLSYSDF